MPKFMIVIYENQVTSGNATPEERAAAIEKYSAWAKSLQDKGVFLGSERLRPEGRVLKPNGKQFRVTDGPYAESKEVFGGYWAIEVANFEEAVECCRNSPHFGYGGTIEIREVGECPKDK